MRALWKGSIRFGLVNIPVRMYTAAQENEFKFTLLHKKDHSKIRYARICKTEEKEIPWNEIVKGFEYSKGEYVVFTEEELNELNLKKTNSIEILNFSFEEEIDSIYYSKPYFLEPEKNAQEAYSLLREALQKSKKVGIAKFAIHGHEHIAAIKAHEDMIILNQLRYHDEVVQESNLKLPKKEKSSNKELDIALKLIDHLTAPFKASNYPNHHAEDLKKIIQQKAKGKKVKAKPQEKQSSKVQDIMSLLKASLEETKPKKKSKRSA